QKKLTSYCFAEVPVCHLICLVSPAANVIAHDCGPFIVQRVHHTCSPAWRAISAFPKSRLVSFFAIRRCSVLLGRVDQVRTRLLICQSHPKHSSLHYLNSADAAFWGAANIKMKARQTTA